MKKAKYWNPFSNAILSEEDRKQHCTSCGQITTQAATADKKYPDPISPTTFPKIL